MPAVNKQGKHKALETFLTLISVPGYDDARCRSSDEKALAQDKFPFNYTIHRSFWRQEDTAMLHVNVDPQEGQVTRTPLNGISKLVTIPTIRAAVRQNYTTRPRSKNRRNTHTHTRYLTEWGWQAHPHQPLILITTNQSAVSPQLMNLVSCACKSDSKKACGCRTAGMVCMEICSRCMERSRCHAQ